MVDHYDIGDLIVLTASFQTGSAYIDPTLVQLEIEEPGGLISAYTYSGGTVFRSSLGHYFYNLHAAKTGQYWYRWYTSGSVISAEEDNIIVDLSEFA